MRAARELRARGDDVVVATIVGARGSTSERPGARMIAEGELLRQMRSRLRNARAVVTTFDSMDEDARASFGLGCNGAIDVLQEIATREPPDPLVVAERCIAQQTVAAIATVVESRAVDVDPGHRVALVDEETYAMLPWSHVPEAAALCREVLVSGRAGVRSVGAFTVFVELLRPPPRLFVFGESHDAVPVVTTARAIGWEVIVCAPTDDVARRIDASHFALAVVMSHDYDQDKSALEMLLGSRARYIGVLGPRARTTTMLEELGCGRDDDRIHTPSSLEQLALALTSAARRVDQPPSTP